LTPGRFNRAGHDYCYGMPAQSERYSGKQHQTVDNTITRDQRWHNWIMPRFLTLADVAEQLQINAPAAYALVRSGELKAIQVGGRGQWRVEEKMLEQYIEERYAEASRMIQEAKSKSV
jgi:excisionase family DNA binding protein